MHRHVVTTRDIDALQIPDGSRVMLDEGTPVASPRRWAAASRS